MHASVRLPCGRETTLGHGDLVGRVSTAALVVDDPRVSEAHALVSHRRGELWLLALRRMISVEGRPRSEVALEPGMRVELAEGLALEIVDVRAPRHVVALEIDGLSPRPLGQVTSLHLGDPPRLVSRFEPSADAHLWSLDEGWRLRFRGQTVREIALGEELQLGDRRARLCAVPTHPTGFSTAREGSIAAPLRIIARYDVVEIHSRVRPPTSIGGIGAQIISELAAMGGPAEWETVAREIWRDPVESIQLRHRWDVSLGRLRTRLRGIGLRTDLVSSDGDGRVHLNLYPDDELRAAW